MVKGTCAGNELVRLAASASSHLRALLCADASDGCREIFVCCQRRAELLGMPRTPPPPPAPQVLFLRKGVHALQMCFYLFAP